MIRELKNHSSGYNSSPIALGDGASLSAIFYQEGAYQEVPNQEGQVKGATSRSAGQLDKLIVLLHGWGADGSDLAPLAPKLIKGIERIGVIIPDAPDICSANPAGKQWFELADRDQWATIMASACIRSAPLIEQMIASLCAEYELMLGDIILGGFSQGGMISLSAGLGFAEPLGGVFCLSGTWLTPDIRPLQDISLPVMLIHGALDPVVPVQAMQATQQALIDFGFSPEGHIRPAMAHEIDAESMDVLHRFIMKIA